MAARVALLRLPTDSRPWWVDHTQCVGGKGKGKDGCQARPEELMRCYLCSSPTCIAHACPVGYSQVAGEQRLGAAHARCVDTVACDERVEYLQAIMQ